jgi:hypothetical protein
MRNFVSYVLASAFVVLLMAVIAPPVGFGLGVSARPPIEGQRLVPQIVDRARKSDRLQVPRASERQTTPPAAPVLVGCEPAFSALSKEKQANFPGRCMA